MNGKHVTNGRGVPVVAFDVFICGTTARFVSLIWIIWIELARAFLRKLLQLFNCAQRRGHKYLQGRVRQRHTHGKLQQ